MLIQKEAATTLLPVRWWTGASRFLALVSVQSAWRPFSSPHQDRFSWTSNSFRLTAVHLMSTVEVGIKTSEQRWNEISPRPPKNGGMKINRNVVIKIYNKELSVIKRYRKVLNEKKLIGCFIRFAHLNKQKMFSFIATKKKRYRNLTKNISRRGGRRPSLGPAATATSQDCSHRKHLRPLRKSRQINKLLNKSIIKYLRK